MQFFNDFDYFMCDKYIYEPYKVHTWPAMAREATYLRVPKVPRTCRLKPDYTVIFQYLMSPMLRDPSDWSGRSTVVTMEIASPGTFRIKGDTKTQLRRFTAWTPFNEEVTNAFMLHGPDHDQIVIPVIMEEMGKEVLCFGFVYGDDGTLEIKERKFEKINEREYKYNGHLYYTENGNDLAQVWECVDRMIEQEIDFPNLKALQEISKSQFEPEETFYRDNTYKTQFSEPYSTALDVYNDDDLLLTGIDVLIRTPVLTEITENSPGWNAPWNNGTKWQNPM
jgi:hypothetical protein